MKAIGKIILGIVLGGTGFGVFLWFWSWALRPELAKEIKKRAPEEVAAAKKAREVSIDPDNPIVINRQVDYSEGKSGRWYPKNESPILAQLVKEGKLPPVAERVGEEPCVMEGVDGIGKHGGTWIQMNSTVGGVALAARTWLSYTCPLRWSPHGYPIVPHALKNCVVSPDNREFVFELRKGMKWSDGHPFTADDIMYWWEKEETDPNISAAIIPIMEVKGQKGDLEKLGPYRVKFSFPEPYGMFLAKLATEHGRNMLNCPAHYLSKFHPVIGDDELIEERMKARKLPSRKAVYIDVKDDFNPEHPRLWPWLFRTYKPNPPFALIRNPYYWVVDSEGNQLPYVDRIVFEVKTGDMIAISAANGDATMQRRYVGFDQYTLLMDGRARGGYDVYHWYYGNRGSLTVSLNLNRRIEPDKPSTRYKHELLNDKRFRQALSLAINRRAIIDAECSGLGEPAQVAPGPESFFYEPKLYKSFVEYDPERANRLLDKIGLTKQNYEGYRTFKDGTPMIFFLNIVASVRTAGAAQFLIDDWAEVGIRVILRERSRGLWYREKKALMHDMNMWSSNGEFLPVVEPRYFVPMRHSANYATAFARWFTRGGLHGDPRADRAHGCIEPPKDHPLRRAMEVYEATLAESDPVRQREVFREALLIAAENVWTINVSTPPPILAVVKKEFRNVQRSLVVCWDFQTVGNAGPETFFFENPRDYQGAGQQIKREIMTATLAPDAPTGAATVASSGRKIATIFRWGFVTLVLLLVVMVAVKHPYVGRRLLIMVPTLVIVSVVVFVVIQLPPGDFITTMIMQLQEAGEEADLQQIEEIKEMFHLRKSVPIRYMYWLGLKWFITFDTKDKGLLQGNMGRSMESLKSVNNIVGDRILLTVLISLGTILFTWAVAIPIGIYSAVRQYSISDYFFTFLGFVGMSIPGFLLALLLMYVSREVFGITVSGLFSSEFGTQPEWTWGKFVDLLKHIWVPIVVLVVSGTAGMIRVMRGNLLDELKKPYVITAMARGVRPGKLLFKYPVRLALNPFISGIGGLFPILVSGGAIVAIVLSLPTVGPLMLSALMSEDMYLAGSMLMVLSLLGVVGTLVSDLLLLWLDPRIRFGGGSR